MKYTKHNDLVIKTAREKAVLEVIEFLLLRGMMDRPTPLICEEIARYFQLEMYSTCHDCGAITPKAFAGMHKCGD